MSAIELALWVHLQSQGDFECRLAPKIRPLPGAMAGAGTGGCARVMSGGRDRSGMALQVLAMEREANMSHMLCIPEHATTRDIVAISESVCRALAAHDEVVLDVSDVQAADLSLIQAIESARRLAARDGRQLRLLHPVPSSLSALLERAGFTAAASPADIDFWFHGDMPQ